MVTMMRRAARGATIATAVALVAACAGNNKEGESYSRDADTGAAAPATVRDMSATPNVGDSTTGLGGATGRTGVAGDTTGSRGQPGATGPNGVVTPGMGQTRPGGSANGTTIGAGVRGTPGESPRRP